MSHERLVLLHLCDSLFPLGAFAHSDGLESAVASGRVATSVDLRGWLDATLIVSLGESDGPAVRDALTAARRGDMRSLSGLDDEIEAMRPAAAGREAARAMGTRLLKTWQQIRPSALVEATLDARPHFTLPVAFGIVCETSAVDTRDAVEAYCYARLAATVSAAMRLMSLGQHEAHGLLAAVLKEVPARVEQVMASAAPPRSFMPLMDIAAMNHQHVHSRLFRS